MSQLRPKIEQEIRERGPIPFSRYMAMCLYDQEFGYYTRNAAQFGKAGDFYTSSDVHAVFGRLLSRQFDGNVARTGLARKDHRERTRPRPRALRARRAGLVRKEIPRFFSRPPLRARRKLARSCQRINETLRNRLHSGKAILRKCPACPATGEGPTILFANEFFDALPVEIISPQGSLRIDARDGRFLETWVPPSPEELEFLDRYSVHPEVGEKLEVPLQAQNEMSAACHFDCGFLIAIDYGYTREEQLAGRHRGTLKAIRQHSVSANPYEAPGEQDITADVNFTALAAAGRETMTCTRTGSLTQSQFLMGIGEANQFADAFEDSRLPQERAKVALQLKHLVTPAGMGESFHVLIASKAVEQRKSRTLTGLSFGNNWPIDVKRCGDGSFSSACCRRIQAVV